MSMNESSMRRALGMSPKAKPIAIHPGVDVVLSVMPNDGGQLRRFRFHCNTISTLQARIEAEKAARAQGFIPWVVLSIGEAE